MDTAYKKMTNHGSINIPVAMRREIGIDKGEAMTVSRQGSEIVIRPYIPRCTFCGSDENIKSFYNRPICTSCIREIVNHLQEQEG